MFCHNPILKHRPTLEHWETKVSTTAKVTIRGSLPVRKQLFILTLQLYKMVFPLWKLQSTSAFWSVQGSGSRIPGFQPSPKGSQTPLVTINMINEAADALCPEPKIWLLILWISTALVMSTCFCATLRLSEGALGSLIYSCVISKFQRKEERWVSVCVCAGWVGIN